MLQVDVGTVGARLPGDRLLAGEGELRQQAVPPAVAPTVTGHHAHMPLHRRAGQSEIISTT